MSNYTGQVAGDIGKKFGEIPSILDWGAPVDGVTDASLAINRAILAVSQSGVGLRGGGTLKVPGGYAFSIHNPIIFSAQTSVTVTANGTNIVVGSGFSDPTTRLNGSVATINSIKYKIDHIVDATHLQLTTIVPAGSGLTCTYGGCGNVSLAGDGFGLISQIVCRADMLDASGNPTVGMINISASNTTIKSIQLTGLVSTPVGVTYATLASSTPAYDPMQDILVKNSTIWVHGGARITLDSILINSSGGYAVL